MDNWQRYRDSTDQYDIYEYLLELPSFIQSLKVTHVPEHVMGPVENAYGQEEHEQYFIIFVVGPIVPDIYGWHTNPEQLLGFADKDKLSIFSKEMNDVRELLKSGLPEVSGYAESKVTNIAMELIGKLEPSLKNDFDMSIEDMDTEYGYTYTFIYEIYKAEWYR